MMDVAIFRLSIPFALVTACLAGLLAVLAWNILQDSPFGTTLGLLAMVMSIATVYHGGLLVVGSETMELQLLLVLAYVLILLALFAALSELNGDSWQGSMFNQQHVLLATVFGLGLYAGGSLLSEVYFPSVLHWVHGVAGLFAIGGLYSPVHSNLQSGPTDDLLVGDARGVRLDAEWMRPIDDAILDVLHASGLVLTPAVIAYNIGYSRDEVNRRLTKLETEELVERVDRGKYRLRRHGE